MKRRKTSPPVYWQKIIKEIETSAHKKALKERIKKYDYYPVLPPRLMKRVTQIVPLQYNDDLEEVTGIKLDVDDGDEEDIFQAVVEAPFNESTCSLVERMEKEYPYFDLSFEYSPEKKEAKKKKENWFSEYICGTKKERIKWKSKIYKTDISISEKTLDEQAEILMDIAAEKFLEWLKTLGNPEDKEMSIAQLKSLFAVEGSSKLLSSIQTEPKEVNAIAKDVADRWNLPEMAIELKYEDYINKHLETAPLTCRKVAFMKTIPYKERPWVRSKEPIAIDTIYPDKLRSGEFLFKGIAHLRSTKALIEHCKRKTNIERPRYLVDNGYFKTTSKAVTETDIPLYERLKVK